MTAQKYIQLPIDTVTQIYDEYWANVIPNLNKDNIPNEDNSEGDENDIFWKEFGLVQIQPWQNQGRHIIRKHEHILFKIIDSKCFVLARLKYGI